MLAIPGVALFVFAVIAAIFAVKARRETAHLRRSEAPSTGDAARRAKAGDTSEVCIRAKVVCREPPTSYATGAPCLAHRWRLYATWHTGVGKHRETEEADLVEGRRVAELSLDDGTGPVAVDISDTAELPPETTTFDEDVKVPSGDDGGADFAIGALAISRRALDEKRMRRGVPQDARYHFTERIVPLRPELLVYGVLQAPGSISNPVGAWDTKMVLSDADRDSVTRDLGRRFVLWLVLGLVSGAAAFGLVGAAVAP